MILFLKKGLNTQIIISCLFLPAESSPYSTLCAYRFALPALRFPLCATRFALPALRLSFCATRFALIVLHYPLCAYRFALIALRFPLCATRFALIALRLSLCATRFALKILYSDLIGKANLVKRVSVYKYEGPARFFPFLFPDYFRSLNKKLSGIFRFLKKYRDNTI